MEKSKTTTNSAMFVCVGGVYVLCVYWVFETSASNRLLRCVQHTQVHFGGGVISAEACHAFLLDSLRTPEHVKTMCALLSCPAGLLLGGCTSIRSVFIRFKIHFADRYYAGTDEHEDEHELELGDVLAATACLAFWSIA